MRPHLVSIFSLRASRATPDECVRGYTICLGAGAFILPAERSDA